MKRKAVILDVLGQNKVIDSLSCQALYESANDIIGRKGYFDEETIARSYPSTYDNYTQGEFNFSKPFNIIFSGSNYEVSSWWAFYKVKYLDE